MRIKSLVALAVISIAPLAAQLAAPNASGDAIGHVHLNVKDIDAQQRFWSQLGGTPVNNEKLQMMQFPGIFVILRKQDSTGGTVGSVINHFGLHIKNLNDFMPKWKAAGIPIEPGNNPKQMFLTGPDDVRVEIIEDSTISTPVAMHHIHMFLPYPLVAQAWYGKNFGAVAGKRGMFDTATVPGAEFTFTKNDMPQVPTKGRSVDHIGFEVKNIDQFVKTLEAAGIHTEAPIRTSANASKLRIAYITDPWGTYIELTEGLTPSAAQSASR
ncbi:MAG TPA: VOC family protein [Bryobacteraceae bacterium]|nr:VOC family protein [Bryobacteraceae bacterium]